MSLVACALGLPCWCSWPRQLIAGEYSYLDLGHFWAVCHVIFGIFHFGGRREENNIIIIGKTRQTHHPPAFIPARPLDFTYRFTHTLFYCSLFSCSNTPLLLLLISPSALTLSNLYFRNTSPKCCTGALQSPGQKARNNIQTPVPDELLDF